MNKLAIEFVRFTLQRNPKVNTFGEIYDALAWAACTRSFHNLGYLELAQVGVSFSLLNIANLEGLILEAQKPNLNGPVNSSATAPDSVVLPR